MKRVVFVLFFMLGWAVFLRGQVLGWAKSFGDVGRESSTHVELDAAENIYVTGDFEGTVDFDPGPSVFSMTAPGVLFNGYILKLNSDGNFIWAKSFGGSDYGSILETEVDLYNNLYVIGGFNSTVDFDPGPGHFPLTNSSSSSDIFIQKFDLYGNFLWAKAIHCSDRVDGMGIESDGLGNIFIAGQYQDTVDLDPGPGAYKIPGRGSFVLKLDAHGNFVWAQVFQDPDIKVTAIMMGVDNEILLTGSFRGSQDLDPGPGTELFVSNPSFNDVFVLKLDSLGSYIWAKTMGGADHDVGVKAMVDLYGNVYATGSFQDTVDFDPGPGVDEHISSGSYDFYIQKLDPTGNFLWTKSFGGTGSDRPHDLQIDGAGNVYASGHFQDTVDFDPGAGIYEVNTLGSVGAFCVRLDDAGNFTWASPFVGTGIAVCSSIAVGDSGFIHCTGHFNTIVDFDPGPGLFNLSPPPGSSGDPDGYIVKLKQDSCSSIALVVDSLADLTCFSPGGGSSHTLHGWPPYSYEWNTVPATYDSIVSFVNSGTYSVTVTDAIGCTRTSSVVVNGPATYTDFDLNANLVTTTFRPGFSSTLWVDAFNDGCMTTSGDLQLIIDTTVVVYDSAVPPLSVVSADTLMWSFSSLTYDSTHFRPVVFVTTHPTVSAGTQACFDLIINPVSGDIDTTNNQKHYCYTVVNAYDPNDKQVYPGVCDVGYIETDSVLTYTIRFQNTGTADAVNVYLLDSLDEDLDTTSIRVISKSHEPMITEVLPGNVLKFRFDDIHLPDSTTNEPESHGYVIFEARPKTGLPVGTVIQNQVGIYFDFNPAVLTNTVMNTVVDSIPVYESTETVSACGNYAWNGTTYDSSGTYVKSLLTVEGCDSSATLLLTVNNVNASISDFGDSLAANLGGATYQWLNCDSGYAAIAGATSQGYKPAMSGNYSVEITNAGCVDTSACYVVLVTGDESAWFNKRLNVFPNPTNSTITIDFNTFQDVFTVEILDLRGIAVITEEFQGKEKVSLELDVPNGVYFLRVSNSHGEVAYRKVIKQ